MRFLVLAVMAVVTVARADTTAFVNVNVVPMTEDVILEGRTVIVEDNVIRDIGPVDDIPVPEGSRVVDGTDRFLMPGLAEMHAHIPPANAKSLERVLSLFVLNGVTSVRGMLGRPGHLRLRDEIEAGETFGPRLVTSGPSLNGNSVVGAADAAAQVEEQGAAGYDFVKLHPGLSRTEFDAIAGAARTANLPFAGHVSEAVGVPHALQSGMASIDHLDGYFVAMLGGKELASGGFGGFFDVLLADFVDASQMPGIAEQTARAGTWNVPTQLLFENVVSPTTAEQLSERAEMRYVPLETVDGWRKSKQQFDASGPDAAVRLKAVQLRRQLIKALHDAGARLLLGSDAPQIFNVPGFSLHRELQILVESGLSPYEALHTGTAAAAEFLVSGAGRIAPGLRADLVLLDDDPLKDIANTRRIHGIMVNGRWISAQERESMLRRFRRED